MKGCAVGGGIDADVGVEGRTRERMLRRGMCERARSLILYLVEVIFDSGLERMWRQERQRLERFVQSRVARGRREDVDCGFGVAWTRRWVGERVECQPSFLRRSIAETEVEGSWSVRPSSGEAASRMEVGLLRLFFLEDEDE